MNPAAPLHAPIPSGGTSSPHGSVINDGHRRDRRFFGLLIGMYVVYVAVFWLSTGPRGLLDFLDWRGFQRLFLLFAPLYIGVLWRQRTRLLPIDRHMTYTAFLVWIGATLARMDVSKGLMNFFIIEPPIIGLLYGIVLLRLIVPARAHSATQTYIARALAFLVLLCSVATAFVVPGVKD